jgi:tetratricopeptide (TPR) repeat protein
LKYSNLLNRARERLSRRAFSEAERLFTQALSVNADSAEALFGRAQCRWAIGQRGAAISDLAAALDLDSANENVLKELVSALLETEQEYRALDVCNSVLNRHPTNVTALTGRDWVLSMIAPLWHVPMMNERERNQAYLDGLRMADVGNAALVFEIGTGSGLMAMMAARLGAKAVVSCEAKRTVAAIAKEVVRINGYENVITILPKMSSQVVPGTDLPRKADFLIHEIFSSELLTEGVLPAIEDAKARLLEPDARIIPGRAAAMIALIGGEAVGNHVHCGQSFGFDLSAFNKTQPTKVPLYREDLKPDMLSDDVEAFEFDFQNDFKFPARSCEHTLTATKDGMCYGLIQWIKLDFGAGVAFENHPLEPKETSNWQHLVYKFKEPVSVQKGDRLVIRALHDRSRLWFDLLKRENPAHVV